MDTDGGGEDSLTVSYCQSRCKKGHMMKTYLIDSDEEAVVDFVNHHEELYNKTQEKFKDKARQDCL